MSLSYIGIRLIVQFMQTAHIIPDRLLFSTLYYSVSFVFFQPPDPEITDILQNYYIL